MTKDQSGLPPVDPALAARLRDGVLNPLTAIHAEVEFLLLSHPDAEVREAAATILVQCRRISGFLRRLGSPPAAER
jgi:hypothetical protein